MKTIVANIKFIGLSISIILPKKKIAINVVNKMLWKDYNIPFSL